MACQALYYCYQEKKYFLRDDKLNWNEFIYHSTKYYPDENGDLYALDGRRVSPIRPNQRIDYKDPNIYEKDISKELIVLRDLYYKNDDIPEWHNILYLDIEIEIGGDLTPQYIRESKMPFTSISMIDATLKQKICFVVDSSKKLQEVNKDGKIIIPCIDEKDLIIKFLNKWEEIDPTIVIGYNCSYFDIPYIYYRIKKILGNEVYRLSPIKKILVKEAQDNNVIQIGGVNCLDYMFLIKKYISKEEQSYKLNDIGEKYVNLGKIEYEGNLDQLFKDDINKFIDYNIRDVEIIEALEEKQKFIQLTILISHLCHTPYESIFWNTVLNEGATLTYLKRKNIVSINKPTTQNPLIKLFSIGEEVTTNRGYTNSSGLVESITKDLIGIRTKAGVLKHYPPMALKKKQGYAGGFLLEPTPGIYKWLSDYDYSSYYPNSIMSLNLGIETLIGRLVIDNPNYNCWWGFSDLKTKNPNQEIEIERLNNQTYTLKKTKTTIGKVIKIIEENNFTISANGVIFRTDIKSIVSEVLSDWFQRRKKVKKEMEEAYKKREIEKGDMLDLKQHALKILLNGYYGGMSINGFRFTDGHKMFSSAITTTCQRLLMETIKYANEMIDEKYINS